jgi:hypothetical protein
MKIGGIWFGRNCFRLGYRGPGCAWMGQPWLLSVRNNLQRNIKIGPFAIVYLPPIKQ